MEVIIKNCDEFYNTFKYVESLASEVKVLCQKDEVWLQVHNPSCTAIAEVKFPAEYFEEKVQQSVFFGDEKNFKSSSCSNNHVHTNKVT